MTRSNDHLQDKVPSQKLEWVTPKISLMVAGDTEGKIVIKTVKEGLTYIGPS